MRTAHGAYPAALVPRCQRLVAGVGDRYIRRDRSVLAALDHRKKPPYATPSHHRPRGREQYVEVLKRAAAAVAVNEVESGMVLGLGTGSTVAHFLELLAARLREGSLEDIVGVPTSIRTADASKRLGISLTDLANQPVLDLTVDGADDVDPRLDLIKGLGGALLREKIVARASRRLVIIADAGKQVDRLGERSPLPVEVVPFAWEVHVPFLRDLGSEPVLRGGPDTPYVTDNGNYIVDCHFSGGMKDPAAIESALQARAGVVESGLFLGMAGMVVIGAEPEPFVLVREAS